MPDGASRSGVRVLEDSARPEAGAEADPAGGAGLSGGLATAQAMHSDASSTALSSNLGITKTRLACHPRQI